MKRSLKHILLKIYLPQIMHIVKTSNMGGDRFDSRGWNILLSVVAFIMSGDVLRYRLQVGREEVCDSEWEMRRLT